MDFSSSNSSSSSSSQYTSSAFPANSSSRPRWGELPIYESTPHFPPPPSMDNAYIALNSQENGRLAAAACSSPSFYSNYAYNYSNYNYGGGASTAGRAEEAAVKEEEGGDRPPEREHMFDKVVTPSDVGKLNRLVIPKQHAEKYFPLDSNSSEKGLLLDFEDRSGKSWRFRYSYWNSSQSYVMTKGWSRFVKEKKLDAGDVVSFQRGLGEIGKDRFYIDWRRRPDAPPPPPHHHHHPHTIQFQHGFSLHRPFLMGPRPPPPLPPPPLVHHHHHQARDHSQLMNIAAQQRGGVISYNGLSGPATSASGYNYNYGDNFGVANPNYYHQGSVVYMRGGGGGGAAFPQQQMQMQMQMDLAGSSTSRGAHDDPSVVFDSVPVAHGGPKSAAAKRLRLFGVNMDCTVTESNVWSSSSPPSLPVNVLNSSSPEAEAGSLQLRLHGDGSASAADSATPNSMQAIEFLDKGKSSMTLDFDI